LLQFWVRNSKFVLVPCWPPHPVGLHVSIEREFFSLEVDVRTTNKDPNDSEDRDIVVADSSVLIGHADDLIWHYGLQRRLFLFLPMLHHNVDIFNPVEHEDKNQKHAIEERRQQVDAPLPEVVVAVLGDCHGVASSFKVIALRIYLALLLRLIPNVYSSCGKAKSDDQSGKVEEVPENVSIFSAQSDEPLDQRET